MVSGSTNVSLKGLYETTWRQFDTSANIHYWNFHIWRVLECNAVCRTHIILLWFVRLSILHLAYYPENCIHGSWLSIAHLSGGLPFRSRLGVRAEGASAGELTGLSSLPPIQLSAFRPPGKQAQLVIVFYAYFKPITYFKSYRIHSSPHL